MNRAAALLMAARMAAWALLFGGWLVLGALGLQHGPGGVLLLAPLAWWLACVALAQRALAPRLPSPWALRGLLLAAGGAAAAGVAQGSWPLAATAWGLLLVAASAVVRQRRQALAGAAAPSPRAAALLAALVAAAVVGEPPAGALLAAWPLLLALGLALLVPGVAPGPARPGCRSSLFDCALGVAPWRAWRRPQARLHAVAVLAMLPMMVLLPWTAEACRGGEAALGPRTLVALHLLAMLLPAWSPRPLPAPALAALLVGGGLVALLLPGGQGPMVAMLLQALAWGAVWREAVVPGPAAGRQGAGGAGAPAVLAVLGIGAGLTAWPGPPLSAMAALAVLLGLAAAWAWLSGWREARRAVPPTRHAAAWGGHEPRPRR